MTSTSTREPLTRSILSMKSPFTFRDVVAAHSSTPTGTLSSILSTMAHARLLTATPRNGKLGVDYAVTDPMSSTRPWPKLSAALSRVERRRAQRRRRGRRSVRARIRPSAPAAPMTLAATIRGWREKAAILDALVSDLHLTDADLAPYANGR